MESTITIYRRTYTRIRVFLNRFDTDFYTPEIGTKFLAETNVKKSTASAYACAIRRLNDIIDSKPFRSHHDSHHVQAPPEFASILEKFLQECMDNRNKPATLQGKERTCGLFLDCLKRTGCTDISRLDTGMVSRSLLTFSNKDRYAVLRQFLRFPADEGITEMDLSGIVPHYRAGMLDYKTIITQHYALHMSGREIASGLGVSKSGVNDFLNAFKVR